MKGDAGKSGHRRNVLARIVGHLLAKPEIGAERAGPAEPDHVAVGRGLGDRFDRDHAAGAGAVLDHDRLAEQLLHARLDDARHRVG